MLSSAITFAQAFNFVGTGMMPPGPRTKVSVCTSDPGRDRGHDEDGARSAHDLIADEPATVVQRIMFVLSEVHQE